MAAVDTKAVRLREVCGGTGVLCSQILATLSSWFGIEESNRDYAKVAERSPAIIASVDGQDVGLLVVVRHSPSAAEIYLMAVRPEWHRHGVGRRLVQRAEETLAGSGVEFLQVKTLSDRHPDAAYRQTRAFYAACGFRPLEELPTLWGPASPALQLIKALRADRSPSVAVTGDLHHLELWVPDLGRAEHSWGLLLEALGYQPFQRWPEGRSWRRGGHYVVVEQSPALSADSHDRCRPGLNHVAFHAGTRAELDAMTSAATAHGWNLLFVDRHPFAGGAGHYASFLEDTDGFEVELVAHMNE
jgi:GNAT superfamily N-acetyltransferase